MQSRSANPIREPLWFGWPMQSLHGKVWARTARAGRHNFFMLLFMSPVNALCRTAAASGGAAARFRLLPAIVLAMFAMSPVRAQPADTSSLASASASGAASAPASPSPPAGPLERAPLSNADREFMIDLAVAMRSQVDASLLAVLKARDPAFQNFAREMADTHEARLKQLSRLARERGLDLPLETSDLHRKRMKIYRETAPAQFQREYARDYGVQNLRWMRRVAVRALERPGDAGVRNLAAELIPELDNGIRRGEALLQAGGRRPRSGAPGG
jgi:predicted outer membrane protein